MDNFLIKSPKLRSKIFNRLKIRWQKYDKRMLEYTTERFIFHKERGVIPYPEKDISTWFKRPFREFHDLIVKLDQEYDIKQQEKIKQKDIEYIFENDKILVLKPNSYEACCKYGYNTKWCVTDSETPMIWNHYTKYNKVFCFIPKHNDDDKKCCLIVKNGNLLREIADELDYSVSYDKFLKYFKKYDGPEDFFIKTKSGYIKPNQKYLKNIS